MCIPFVRGLAWCLGVIVLAGCAEEQDTSTPPGGAANATATGANATATGALPDLDMVLPTTYWFTPEMGLAPAPPQSAEASRVPQPVGTDAFVTGVGDPVAWIGGEMPVDRLVTAARVVFFVTSEGASVSMGPGTAGLPEFFSWFGPEASPMGGGTPQGPDSFAPGQVAEIAYDVGLPEGGIVVEAGEPLYHGMVSTYPQSSDANRLVFLVGGTDAPSRIELSVETVFLPDAVESALPVITGTVRGDGCTAPPQEGTQMLTFPVKVPDGAIGFRATLDRTGGAATNEDMDLQILGPDGSGVAAGHSPRGDELVRLYLPNIAAIGTGDWSVRVLSCTSQSGDFTVTPVVLVPTEGFEE